MYACVRHYISRDILHDKTTNFFGSWKFLALIIILLGTENATHNIRDLHFCIANMTLLLSVFLLNKNAGVLLTKYYYIS